MRKTRERITIFETFGINEPISALKDSLKAAFGENNIPPTQWDLSSLKVFKPHISIPTWLGIRGRDRKAPLYNFFNRETPPPDAPFSVKVTFARDYRGGQYTYDSHPGTDFAVPVGTHIVTCAPGKVINIKNQLDHGGLKIFVDHGEGLITTYGHLSRALVGVGDIVSRGQSVGLSGAAGMELILFFPWVSPHLHLNVVLNGKAVDPFAVEEEGEVSLWLGNAEPLPHTGAPDSDFRPTEWNADFIDAAIEDCSDPGEREKLRSIADLETRASEIINHRMFYNTLFSEFPPIYEKEYPRKPVLDLPLRAEDYDGARFPD